MIARNLLIVSVVLSLGAFLMFGCGQQTGGSSATTATVSVSGNINSGTVSSSSIKTLGNGMHIQAIATSPLAGYTVLAVDRESGDAYISEAVTDADGKFTISDLPSGESFYFELLDSNSKLVAPISFGNANSKAIMAINASSNLDLGQIAYDSSKGGASPTVEPTALLDSDSGARLKAGESFIPIGSGNYGKSDDCDNSSSDDSSSDGDRDGLPNFVDADNDGNGVLDEIDGRHTLEVIPSKARRPYLPYVFTNLKVQYEDRDTFQSDYSEFNIAVGLDPAGISGKTISKIYVTGGPSWLTKAMAYTSDPSSAVLWSASSYEVTKGSTKFEIFLNGLTPFTDVNAGDVLRFKIIYSDGTIAHAVKMINFVFKDIPRISQYSLDKGVTWIDMPGGTSSVIGSASTAEVYLKWSRPRDETDSEILGGKYTYEYNVSGSLTMGEITIIEKDTESAGVTLEGGTNLGSLADVTSGQLFIGLCIRSKANDNSAENIIFTKGW